MRKNKTIRTTLENGLTVVLREVHSAPIVSLWVWYRVGSRNETAGATGVSHWVEHMQFKGTAKYGPGEADRAVSRVGGVWNAMTAEDWTTYYETVPDGEIDLVLDLEADRMVGSLFLPEEVDSERTVILSEREGLENDPMFKLDDAVKRAAFDVHPYRNEIIGETADLNTMGRDDLYRYYRNHYAPNNAVLTMAGNFDADETLEKIRARFGPIPRAETDPCAVIGEGEIPEARSVEVSGPGQLAYVQLSWRAPSARDDAFFVLAVLTSILAGPASLNQFGGGGTGNRMSRLYRALVETGLAVGIAGDFSASIDPGLYSITLVLNSGVAPEEAVAAVDREIERIHRGEISAEEVAKAARQARAMFIFGSEDITNIAFWLGYSEMFADGSWFDSYVDRVAAVTASDVIDYAKRCLRTDNRVVGLYDPQDADFSGAEFSGETGPEGAEADQDDDGEEENTEIGGAG